MPAMKWADVRDIAMALEDTYPDVEILGVRFTDLHRWVCELPDFADDPEASSEKTLEAIQMTWLDERDD
jgi:FeS assembly protein IscX